VLLIRALSKRCVLENVELSLMLAPGGQLDPHEIQSALDDGGMSES
jgi:hypothetical protein